MWSVSPPKASASEVATACARGTRDRTLARNLLAARQVLEINSAALRAAVSFDATHLLSAAAFAVPNMSGDDVKWMYTRQVAGRGRPARAIYDQIISAAPDGLCCYCQYGQAKTLDHFVPQDFIGTLAIDPWNLVPACEQCNHKLLARWSSLAEDQFLHPYEMPAIGKWLSGRVNNYSPVTLEFRAEPASTHSSELQARIKGEFDALGLGEMYAVVSAGDVAVATRTLSRLFSPGEGSDVRAHLVEVAQDAFAHDENSRRGVVLQALADDAWFCSGGFAIAV